jgi:hypothetical protein
LEVPLSSRKIYGGIVLCELQKRLFFGGGDPHRCPRVIRFAPLSPKDTPRLQTSTPQSRICGVERDPQQLGKVGPRKAIPHVQEQYCAKKWIDANQAAQFFPGDQLPFHAWRWIGKLEIHVRGVELRYVLGTPLPLVPVVCRSPHGKTE